MSDELNWRKVEIRSKRMSIKPFVADDAHDVFRSITMPITRYMDWEPPTSWPAFAPVWQSWLLSIRRGSDVHFVLRTLPELRYLGLVGLHGVALLWGQAVVGEIYMWAVAVCFAALGWKYNALLLIQGVIVSVGIGMLAKAFAPGARVVEAA